MYPHDSAVEGRGISANGRMHRASPLLLPALAMIAAFWTLYAYWSNFNLDRYQDMLENYALGRVWALGYPKHPPLFEWTTAGWFAIFPVNDLSYRILAALNLTIGLGLMARLSRRFLDPAQQMAALAVSLAVPLSSFQALTYNANSAMIPYWAGAALAYFHVIERRSYGAALMLGVCIAFAILVKYYSAVLIITILAHSLIDSRVRPLWSTGLPWISLAAAGILLTPHLVWLTQNGMGPVAYAALDQGERSFANVAYFAGYFLVSQIGYAAPGFAPLALYRRRGDARALFDFPGFWSLLETPQGRALLSFGVAPLFLSVVLSFAVFAPLTANWSIPVAIFWPVLLTLFLQREIANRRANTGLAFIVAFIAVLLAASPIIRMAILKEAGVNSAIPVRRMVEAAERSWRELTGRPLKFVTGDSYLAYGASFYAAGNPLAVPAERLLTGTGFAGEIDAAGIQALCQTPDCISPDWLAANGFTTNQTISVPAEPGAGGPASYSVYSWIRPPAH